MLRSCYSTDVYWFRDDTAHVGTIRWYFAPEGAKCLPFPTVFASRNWDDEFTPKKGVGEVYGAKRPWRNGETPAGVDGQKPCGKREDYEKGVVYDPTRNVIRNADGISSCCAKAKGKFINGGLILSGIGQVLQLPPAANPCGVRFGGIGGFSTGAMLDIAGVKLDGQGVLLGVPPPPNVGGMKFDGQGVLLGVPPPPNVGGIRFSGLGVLAMVPPPPNSTGTAGGGTGGFRLIAYLIYSNESITAAGSTQATATPIGASDSLVSGADGTKGVILPVDWVRITVVNNGSANLKVYPPVGGRISGGSANAPTSLTAGAVIMFITAGFAGNFVRLIAS